MGTMSVTENKEKGSDRHIVGVLLEGYACFTKDKYDRNFVSWKNQSCVRQVRLKEAILMKITQTTYIWSFPIYQKKSVQNSKMYFVMYFWLQLCKSVGYQVHLIISIPELFLRTQNCPSTTTTTAVIINFSFSVQNFCPLYSFFWVSVYSLSDFHSVAFFLIFFIFLLKDHCDICTLSKNLSKEYC